MAGSNHHNDNPRGTAVLAALALTILVASVSGAAERVVLGEYFTNLF